MARILVTDRGDSFMLAKPFYAVKLPKLLTISADPDSDPDVDGS